MSKNMKFHNMWLGLDVDEDVEVEDRNSKGGGEKGSEGGRASVEIQRRRASLEMSGGRAVVDVANEHRIFPPCSEVVTPRGGGGMRMSMNRSSSSERRMRVETARTEEEEWMQDEEILQEQGLK